MDQYSYSVELRKWKSLLTTYVSNNISNLILDFKQELTYDIVRKKYMRNARPGNLIGIHLIIQKNGKLQKVKLERIKYTRIRGSSLYISNRNVVFPHTMIDIYRHYMNRSQYVLQLDSLQMEDNIVTEKSIDTVYTIRTFTNFFVVKWKINKQNVDKSLSHYIFLSDMKNKYLLDVIGLPFEDNIMREGTMRATLMSNVDYYYYGFIVISRNGNYRGRLIKSEDKFFGLFREFIIGGL